MPRNPEDTSQNQATEKKGEKPAVERPEQPERIASVEETMDRVEQEMDAGVAGVKEGARRIEAGAAAKGDALSAEEVAASQEIVAEAEAAQSAQRSEIKVVSGESPVEFMPSAEDAEVFADLTEDEIEKALEPLGMEIVQKEAAVELPSVIIDEEKLPGVQRFDKEGRPVDKEGKPLEAAAEAEKGPAESPEMQVARQQVSDLEARIEAAKKTDSMNFPGGAPGKKIELESLEKKLAKARTEMEDRVVAEAEARGQRAGKSVSAEKAAAEVLKKEGFVDVAPAEILKTLDRKDMKELHRLLAEGEADKIKEFLDKQIDKVAAGSEAKDRLMEIKAECVASLQETFKQTLDQEVSTRIMNELSFKEKASVFAGPIMKKVALNIGLGLGAGIGAAAVLGTGGLAAVAAGGAMAGWRLIENSSWGKKMLSKVGLGGPNMKRFEDLQKRKQAEVVDRVLNSEAVSALIARAITRSSSKDLVKQIKDYQEQGLRVEAGKEKDLEKFDKALGKVSPEFFRAALAKIKAERPELGPEQAKEAAMLVALTTARFEKGQALEDQARNAMKQDKPNMFNKVMETFTAARAGTGGDTKKEKLAFGAAAVALGAATASIARQGRWGRAVTGGIAGAMAGFVLGKRAEAKAMARVVEESEKMVAEAEKKLEDIDFPSENLESFRAEAAQVLARLESGMFDKYPALKERAENFIFQVDKLEMKNRQNMDQLLDILGQSGDKVAEQKQADLAKLDKIYKSGQRRKVLYVIGGAALGATAGYFAQDAVDYMKKQMGLAQTQEAVPAKPGEQRPADSLEPRKGEPGFIEEPPPQEVKLTPEQIETQELAALGTIRKGDGITHALVRQLEYKLQRHPELAGQYGFKGDINNAAAVHRWAVLESKRIAIDEKYILPDGRQVRVRFDAKDPAQYLLQEKGGKFSVVEQHTEGHEFLWRKPPPPAVETTVEPPPLAEIPKQQLPKELNLQQTLDRLRGTGSDPVLDERLRLNLARGNQTPEDVAWLKSELGKRFEIINGELQQKTAELTALQELKAKTADPDLLQRLTAQEQSLRQRITTLNQTAEAYHRTYLQPREQPVVIDRSTGRQPIKPAIPSTMRETGPELTQVAQRYNLSPEATKAMTAANLRPEQVESLIREIRGAKFVSADQAILGESWLARAGNTPEAQDALRKSLLQMIETGQGAGKMGKIDIGGGRTLDYATGFDAKRAAQWLLENRLGVKLKAPGGAIEAATMTELPADLPPQSRAFMERLAETPFSGGKRVSLEGGVQASIALDQAGHPKVRFEWSRDLDPKIYESHYLADNWQSVLAKAKPADIENIRRLAFQAHYAEEMIGKLKASGVAQTEEGAKLLSNLERDMRSARVGLVRSIDSAAINEVGEAQHRGIIEKISKLTQRPKTGGEQVEPTVGEARDVTNVGRRVEVREIEGGIAGKGIKEFTSAHGRVRVVYDVFGRARGLQTAGEFRLGPDDVMAAKALIKPGFVPEGGNPALVRAQVENTARTIYGYRQIASELRAAGHTKEADEIFKIAKLLRRNTMGRVGDAFVELPE